MHPQVYQDLGSNAIPAKVGRESQVLVGLYGVQAVVLELVSSELVVQSNTAAFLAHVEKDTTVRSGDEA